MSVSMSQELQEEFRKYKIDIISEFVQAIMPIPDSTKYTFFKVKSLDDKNYYVWGTNADEILYQFKRYVNLRIFT